MSVSDTNIEAILNQDGQMPVAIVGMACHLPGGASSPSRLWDLLTNKRSGWKEFPKDRFDIGSFYHPDADHNGTINVRAGHILEEDIGQFDAGFFSISPAEAKAMDPQQRMLMETTYEALESAGVSLSAISGTATGCYVGSFTRDFCDVQGQDAETIPTYLGTGAEAAMLSNRLSYTFNIHGPSFTLSTACSSSLIALHMACQGLRVGETEAAIVAGTNLIFNPDIIVGMTNMHFLSPDGKCFTFDQRANGYARGEGIVALYLKPLAAALRDNDPIRAVIRGSGSNQDGFTSGITVPSRSAQENLIKSTYQRAGCDPAQVGYFEAHGTGTAAGDPIETRAIGAALGVHRPEGSQHGLYVGSIKPNIGHLEAASGLAGVIKCVLALEHGLIPPNINFEKGNEAIDFDGWRIRVPTETVPWPVPGVRRASVNSFGFGGSNAHVILDDVGNYLRARGLLSLRSTKEPQSPTLGSESSVSDFESITHAETASDSDIVHVDNTRRYRVFLWSARDEKAVKNYASSLGEFLDSSQSDDELLLKDLSYTLTERRSEFAFRSFVICDGIKQLSSILKTENIPVTISDTRSVPSMAFIFTGQGAQWYAMGRELYWAYPVFRAVIDRASDIIFALGSSWNLLRELFKPEEQSLINSVHISQPLCTAVQLALVELLEDWNILPQVVVGHSSGEIAAAFCAGKLSLEGAIRVAYFRGLVSSEVTRKGSMAAVGLKPVETLGWIAQVDDDVPGQMDIACYNSPSSVTVSGDTLAVNALVKLLQSQDIFARKLKVDVAYHSHHMEDVAQRYLALMGDLEPPAPDQSLKKSCVMISSVTGKTVTAPLGAQYWVDNMLSPVRFSDALAQVTTKKQKGRSGRQRTAKSNISVSIILEVGPHSALAGPVKQIIKEGKDSLADTNIGYYSCLVRNKHACETLLSAAGALWSNGVKVNFGRTNRFDDSSSKPRVLVDLPAYQWSHKRHWAESRISINHRFRRGPRHHLLGYPVKDWNPQLPRWRNIITVAEQPWLKDHVVQGSVVYPGAGYICMAVTAMAFLHAGNGEGAMETVVIKDMVIDTALVVPDTEQGVELAFNLRPVEGMMAKGIAGTWFEFTVFSFESQSATESTEHCRGLICINESPVLCLEDLKVDPNFDTLLLDSSRWAALPTAISITAQTFYSDLQRAGLSYGPSFQNIHDIQISAFSALTSITVPDTVSSMPAAFDYPHAFHPAFIDAIFQSFLATLTESSQVFVPTFVEELTLVMPSADRSLPKAEEEMKTFVNLDRVSYQESVGRFVCVAEESGGVVVHGSGIRSVAFGKPVRGVVEEVPRLVLDPVWRPDVETLSAIQLEKILNQGTSIGDEFQDIQSLDKAALYFFQQAKSSTTDPSWVVDKHRKLWDYMNLQLSLLEESMLPFQTKGWMDVLMDVHGEQMFHFIQSLKCSGALPEAVCRVGSNLASILCGQTDPLSLLSSDGLLTETYKASMNGLRQQASNLVSLLSHKNPNLKILEVGAGTGSATLPILQVLKDAQGEYARCHSYTFTDISSAFLAAAEDRFSTSYADLLRFRKFNMSEDPVAQGFTFEEKYDVIIAFCVVHVAADVKAALRNIRQLLRPSGRLILTEVTTPRNGLCLPFLVLPGWFDCEEEWRPWGPLMDEETWRVILAETGFKVGSVTKSCEGAEGHAGRMFVVQAIEEAPTPTFMKALVAKKAIAPVTIAMGDINGGISEDDTAFAASLVTTLLGVGMLDIIFRPFVRMKPEDFTGRVIICTSELEHVIVQNMNPTVFSLFQTIMSDAKGLVWLTRGVFGAAQRPEVSMIHGLLRTLRWEYGGFEILTFDYSVEPRLLAIKAISLLEPHLLRLLFGEKEEKDDSEFWEQEGLTYIKRCLPRMDRNRRVAIEAKRQSKATVSMDIFDVAALEPFMLPERSLRLYPGNPLKNSPPTFVVDLATPYSSMPLLPNHVVVEIRAVSISPRDAMRALGQLPWSNTGFEFAGTITASTTPSLPISTRVCGWASEGPLRGLVAMPAVNVAAIPSSLSFAQAAALPRVLPVALACVSFHGKARRNERMLIWNAASGLGYALARMAEVGGITEVCVAVTSESSEKMFVMDHIGIKEDKILVTDMASIRNKNHGRFRNFDVVVNIDNEANMLHTLSLVSPGGCLINVTGGTSTPEITKTSGANLNFSRVSRNRAIWTINADDPSGQQALENKLETALALLSSKWNFPGPVTRFPISDISSAFSRALANSSRPVVVTMEPADMVPVSHGTAGYQFTADASYLIVGGLSGIGASFARHLVTRGAKNLVLLSRRGASTPESQALVSELTTHQGVTVVSLACDVSDRSKLSTVLSAALETLPPLKGVIQGAMVLQDRVFRNMTPEQFSAVTAPRVTGTWNLHALTQSLGPRAPLDFFVMLSSSTGMIGDSGQANYTAANSFLDAMAHHRQNLGLPASVVDLGMIGDVGYIAADVGGSIARNLEQWGYVTIRESEVRGLLELAVDPKGAMAVNKGWERPQMVTGLAFTDSYDASDPPNWVRDPVFSHVKPQATASLAEDDESSTTLSIPEQLCSSPNLFAARELVAGILKRKLAKTLVIAVEELDMGAPAAQYGLDSLVAVELRSWVVREMGADLPIFDIIQAQALSSLVDKIVEGSSFVKR